MSSRAQALIAFFSAMAVTLAAVSYAGRRAPGPLATVHQREPELAGRDDCSACHGGLLGMLREACLECHAAIAAQLEAAAGLHGRLGGRAEQCGLCHAEHHGASAPLVHGRSFALAGVPDEARFDHALVGFPMDGAHLALDCSACHANARAMPLAKGATRYLGLDRDCASCHEDPHRGRMTLACAACHGQEAWAGLASLGHERFLPLSGGHDGLDCAHCHAGDGPHALALLGEAREPASPRTCAGCHESPHTQGFVAAAAGFEGTGMETVCAACHASEHTSFHDRGLLDTSARLHAASGFPLDAPHAGVECRRCHAGAEQPFAERYPGRERDRCSACHEDVHGGQFAGGPFARGDCLACHERTRFAPHAFAPEQHARTALALTGRHLETDCAACHRKPAADAARVFRGTPHECEACHADAHGGFFDGALADLPRPAHGACEHCHDTASFAGAERGFDHARFTGFPLLGAHAESDCAACHPAQEPDASGRRFGRVTARSGTFTACTPCHADPHGGRFDAGDVPASAGGREGCARCHGESSFRVISGGFDHGAWTGFALLGAHGEASCSACHAPLPIGTSGRTSHAARGTGCADCHEDPHAGQFADGFGETDCRRCHDEGRARFLAFDHERDARFQPGAAHRSLECEACHRRETRDGLAFTRFKPLGSECVDCHGTSAEVPLLRRPRR